MTQNGSSISYIPVASNNKGTCLFYLPNKRLQKKKQYKQTSKAHPTDGWFFLHLKCLSDHSGYCAPSHPLPHAPAWLLQHLSFWTTALELLASTSCSTCSHVTVALVPNEQQWTDWNKEMSVSQAHVPFVIDNEGASFKVASPAAVFLWLVMLWAQTWMYHGFCVLTNTKLRVRW